MAIFHLTTKVFSRGKGQSAIAAAAYRSGQRLFDEADGLQKSYQGRADRIEFEGMFVPANTPAWAKDRNQFWNRAEQAETRRDGRLAREIEVALPHELTAEQRQRLVQDFVREQFVRKGYAADVAIHGPDRGDPRNHHAHILISERKIGPDGFADRKDPAMNSKAQLHQWREQWANLANRHLARHGHAARIDHRSLDAQGIDREPTTHLGYAAAEMTKRGAQSDRVDEYRGIVARNDERADLRQQLAATDKEIVSLEAEGERLAKLEREKAAQLAARSAEAAESSRRTAADAKLAATVEKAATIERQVGGDRQAAEEALRRLAIQDARPTEIGKAFKDSAREGAQQARAERREGEFWDRQATWQASLPQPRTYSAPKPRAPGLHVMDSATGAVSKLGDFITDLLAGAPPPPPAQSKGAAVAAFVTNPAARREQQQAARQAGRAAEAADKALERMRQDMAAGRNLKSEDIRSLTRQHQEQIRHFGDNAVTQMVQAAQKRAEGYWKGEDRERERER